MNKLGIFLKRHGPMILTAFSVAGTITTALVARADAKKEIDIFEKERPKTKGQKLICYAKCYWKTGLTVIFSSACSIGSHTITAKQIAAVTAAATLVEENFRKYRNAIIERLGEDEEKDIYIESTEKVWHLSPTLPEGSDETFFYDTFTERFFRATPERVEHAIYHLNRNFQLRKWAFLSEFYDFIGLESTDLHKTIGWSSDYYYEQGFEPWIDIYTVDKISKNGIKYFEIRYDFEPCLSAVKDYV